MRNQGKAEGLGGFPKTGQRQNSLQKLEFTSSAQDSYQGLRKEHLNDIVKRTKSEEQTILGTILAQKQHTVPGLVE